MISRVSLGILFAALAFAIAAPLHAAPAASVTAPIDSVTYHIERHNQQVMVKDANEKTLVTCTAATQTIQGFFVWSAAGPAANTPRRLTLTLKDENSRSLWSTPVSVVYPQSVSVGCYDDTGSGTQLVVRTTRANPADPDYLPASSLSFAVGADGRLISFGSASHQYKYVHEADTFSVVDQDGQTVIFGYFVVNKLGIHGLGRSRQGLHLNPDGTVTIQIDGKNVEPSEPSSVLRNGTAKTTASK